MINQQNSLQSTTQKYLELFDITNDVLILQDGAVSMVLNSTAINFDLYSEEEQDAAIYAYAALLNSLSFSIEIIIRSQRKDVTSYLELLHQAEIKAYNPINKRNIRDYRQFVEELVQERNVLDKKFYIVITYTALEAGIITGSTFIPGMKKKAPSTLDKGAVLEKALTNLAPRRDHLIHQFARIGLSLRQLTTQELIQLFYTTYNPDSSEGMHVTTPSEYATPLVETNLPPLPIIQAKLEQNATAVPIASQAAPDKTAAVIETEQIPQIEQPTAPLPSPVESSSLPIEFSDLPAITIESASTPPSSTDSKSTPDLVSTPNTPIIEANAIKEDSFTLATQLSPPTPPTLTTEPKESEETA